MKNSVESTQADTEQPAFTKSKKFWLMVWLVMTVVLQPLFLVVVGVEIFQARKRENHSFRKAIIGVAIGLEVLFLLVTFASITTGAAHVRIGLSK